MRVARVLLRRSIAQWGQLVAALAIAAVASGALLALLVVPASGLDRGVAALLADAEPTAGALRLETALADDAAEQTARVEDALTRAIAGAPIELVRAVRGPAVNARVGGEDRQLVLAAHDDLDRLARLVDGSWAASDDEVTLAEPAAAALGVTVGDTLELPAGDHLVVGVWRARDTGDAAWFSETLVASGRLGDAVGPVIVPAQELDGLDPRARVSWTLVPREVDAADLAALGPVEGRVRAAASELASGTSYAVTVSGGLADTLARARDAVASARVLTGTAVVLVLVTSGIVLALVGGALAQVRSLEAELLAARGLSRARAAALALGEAAVVIGIGVALGIGAALPLTASADAVVPPSALLAVAGSGLLGIALFAIAARPVPATRGARGQAEGDSVIPALAVTVLAGFAVVTADAVATAPVRFVAPALALVAGVLLLRLLLAPGMRIAERVASRGAGLLPVLPLRQLGRRPRAVAGAFIVVALAAGAVVTAALAQGAAARDHDAEVRAAVGAAVRVSFSNVDRDPVTAEPYARLEGVTAATEVALASVQLGSTSTELLVADEGFEAVTGLRPPAVRADALPVRVTPALADQLGVVVGDGVPLSFTGVRAPVPGVVAEIAEVPGLGTWGLLAARDGLAERLPAEDPALAVDEVWLASASPDATAARVREATSRAATVLTPTGAGSLAVVETGVTGLVASAWLVVLVGIGGLAAAAAAVRRVRRGEVMPLRALGVGASAQARGRFVELVLTALVGAVAGALAGTGAMWFATGAVLADTGAASAVLLALGAVLMLGVVVVALVAAVAVRRDAEVRA